MSEYDFASPVPEDEYYIFQEPWGEEGDATVVISRQGIIDMPHKLNKRFRNYRQKVEHFQTTHMATKLTRQQFFEYMQMIKSFFERVAKENQE